MQTFWALSNASSGGAAEVVWRQHCHTQKRTRSASWWRGRDAHRSHLHFRQRSAKSIPKSDVGETGRCTMTWSAFWMSKGLVFATAPGEHDRRTVCEGRQPRASRRFTGRASSAVCWSQPPVANLKGKTYTSPAAGLHKHKKLPPLACAVQMMATDLLEVTALPFSQLPRLHDVSASGRRSLEIFKSTPAISQAAPSLSTNFFFLPVYILHGRPDS